MASQLSENVHSKCNTPESVLKLSALKSIALALQECTPELREQALVLMGDLGSGQLDEYDTQATTALLAEILFPSSDEDGLPGMELKRAEGIAKEICPESKEALRKMDEDESAFADRLRDLMQEKKLTQAALAEKVGVGQPAIAMMLQRDCRPQKRTVVRIAEALGVNPEQLWPGLAK